MMNLRAPEKKETTTDDPTEDYTTNDQQSPIIIESKITPKDVASSQSTFPKKELKIETAAIPLPKVQARTPLNAEKLQAMIKVSSLLSGPRKSQNVRIEEIRTNDRRSNNVEGSPYSGGLTRNLNF